MALKNHSPTPADQAFVEDVKAVMGKHIVANQWGADRPLALLSVIVGQLVAMQDQTRFTSAQVMEVVAKNIEDGNQRAVEQMAAQKPAGHA